MNINRNEVVPVVMVLVALIGLGSFVGIANKEGWLTKSSTDETVSFAPANEEAVWFCQALEDGQSEPFLILMLDLKGGMKARGWMDSDGSVTPKGEVARTDAMEMCPDLYVAFKRAGDKLDEALADAGAPP